MSFNCEVFFQRDTKILYMHAYEVSSKDSCFKRLLILCIIIASFSQIVDSMCKMSIGKEKEFAWKESYFHTRSAITCVHIHNLFLYKL